MRNTKIDPFLRAWVDPPTLRKWTEVKTQVISILGIKLEDIVDLPSFVDLANSIYKLDIRRDERSVPLLVDIMHHRIMTLSKSTRSRLRKKSLARVGYPIQPKTVKLRKAAAKSGVLNDIGLKQLADRKARRSKKYNPRPYTSYPAGSGKSHSPTKDTKETFYKSWEWRTLRMEVLKDRGARCECCGATPSHNDMNGKPVKICVDHIKPLSKHWGMRLNKTNLQILCDECNQGKGAWDETDWRSDAENGLDDCDDDNEIPECIRDQLRYSI